MLFSRRTPTSCRSRSASLPLRDNSNCSSADNINGDVGPTLLPPASHIIKVQTLIIQGDAIATSTQSRGTGDSRNLRPVAGLCCLQHSETKDQFEISKLLNSVSPLTRNSFLQKTRATATPTRRTSALRLRPPPRSRCLRCGAWTAATVSWWSGAPTAGSRSGRRGRALSSEKSC